MLQSLNVSNYALIQSLELDFRPNYTTITGETGSGKSILLGALGLILGERADTTVLQDKSRKCIVEGAFELSEYASNYTINNFFERHDLDYDHLTTIRREITPNGRSRAFVNDTPVTLAQLKELTTQLVDIHSQHETLTINDSEFQLSVVDSSAGNEELLLKYHQEWKAYRDLKSEMMRLEEEESRSKLDLDFYQFQVKELDEADLKEGEETVHEEELQTLANAEDIKRVLHGAVDAFSGDSTNLLATLKEIRTALKKIAGFNASLGTLNERLNSASLELEDVAAELEQMADDVAHNPERLQWLNDRLDLLNSLMNKHRVTDSAALIALHTELDEKVNSIGSLSEDIEKLRIQIQQQEEKLTALASKISAKRQKALPKIMEQVHGMLSLMAMPHAKLEIECTPLQTFGPNGMDRVRFLFKANKGGDLKELGKVASGGELSRLMLSIKALMASVKTLPTIILDEIDTGISGDVADKAGNIMKQMATNMQVICITHLPQIASKGDHHYKVAKETTNDSTITCVHILNETERVDEIAKMLSGESLSEAAIENAKVLLSQ